MPEMDQRLMAFEAVVIRAKAELCDAQHSLQKAEEAVSNAQKVLATAEARRDGAAALIEIDKQQAQLPKE